MGETDDENEEEDDLSSETNPKEKEDDKQAGDRKPKEEFEEEIGLDIEDNWFQINQFAEPNGSDRKETKKI